MAGDKPAYGAPQVIRDALAELHRVLGIADESADELSRDLREQVNDAYRRGRRDGYEAAKAKYGALAEQNDRARAMTAYRRGLADGKKGVKRKSGGA